MTIHERLLERYPLPYTYRCTDGHWVGSRNAELDGDDEMGTCPVPQCAALIGQAYVPAWMLSRLDGTA